MIGLRRRGFRPGERHHGHNNGFSLPIYIYIYIYI